MKLYKEPLEIGSKHREVFAAQFQTWLDNQYKQAEAFRTSYFQPDMASPQAYGTSIERYRRDFIKMLGLPLTTYDGSTIPGVREEFVASDDLGSISRLWIEVLPGVELYGILFVPKGEGPFPLVLSQHGGGGTPELTSHFFGESNYNNMTRRVLQRRIVVFAPQLFRWDPRFGKPFEKDVGDNHLKQLGGSIAAFEILCLRRAIDYLQTLPNVVPERIGMIGLSYGGFFTLFTAAAETRIKVALSSCFFNDRRKYGWQDWAWQNAALQFFDAEVAALVCPRPLYLEVGQVDELFDVASAREESKRVRAIYDALGLGDLLIYREHEGKHELDPGDDGINFLEMHLRS